MVKYLTEYQLEYSLLRFAGVSMRVGETGSSPPLPILFLLFIFFLTLQRASNVGTNKFSDVARDIICCSIILGI